MARPITRASVLIILSALLTSLFPALYTHQTDVFATLTGTPITVAPSPYEVTNMAVSGSVLYAFAYTSTNDTVAIFRSSDGVTFTRVEEIEFPITTYVYELGAGGLPVDADGNIWFGTYTNIQPYAACVYRFNVTSASSDLILNMTGPPGVVGNATEFDGDDATSDYISMANSASLNISSSMSFEAWLRFDNFTNGQTEVFAEKGFNAGDNIVNYLFGKNASGALMFAYNYGGWTTICDTSGWTPTSGVWYDVWIITNQTDDTVNFWVNGTLLSSVEDTNGLNYTTTTYSMRIAQNTDVVAGGKFYGAIDSIRLYNRTVRQTPFLHGGVVIDASEVLYSWNSSGGVIGGYTYWHGHVPYNDTGLVGWWKLDEGAGAGAIIADASGNGNTGTLVDADSSVWITGCVRTDFADYPKYKHIHDIEVSSTTNTVFVAFGDYGVYTEPELYRSQDNGSSWEALSQLDVWAVPGRQVTALCEDNGTMYAGGEIRSRIWQSTDDGDTWTTVKDHVDATAYITGLYADGDELACVTNEVASFWMSGDGGDNWYRGVANDTVLASSTYFGLLGIAKAGDVYVVGSETDNRTYATPFYDKSVNPEFEEGGLTHIGDFGYPTVTYGGYVYFVQHDSGVGTRVLSSSLAAATLIDYGSDYVDIALGSPMTANVSYTPQVHFTNTSVSSDDFADDVVAAKWNHYGAAAEYLSESNGMLYLRQGNRGYLIDNSTELSGDWSLKLTLTMDGRPDGETPSLEDWRVFDVYFNWQNETFYHKMTWMFNVTQSGNSSAHTELTFNDDITFGATQSHLYSPFARVVIYTGSQYNVSTPNVMDVELRRYNDTLSFLFNNTEVYRHYYNRFPANWTGTPSWSDGFFGFGCYVSDLYVLDYELSTLTTYSTTYPSNHDVDITDMEGCGNWVFSEESYYTFQAQYVGDGYHDLDTVKLAFTCGYVTLYDQGWVNVSYGVSSAEFAIDTGGDLITLKAGAVTAGGNFLQVAFLIYFKNTMLDANDVDLYLWCNDTTGAESGWELVAADYFTIYNLGGHSTLITSGDAGRISGGDVFDLYVNASSAWAYASIEYRNLQHVKLLPLVEVSNMSGSLNFFLKYGIEYCVGDDEWVTGWWVTAQVTGFTVGSSRSVDIAVQWVQGESTSIYLDFLYYYPRQNDTEGSFRYWVDFWFNKQNASSVGAGRLNAYEYPMKDNANPWLAWLTGNNWGMDDSKTKECMVVTELLDADGNRVHTQEITLVRFWFNLTNAATSNEVVEVKNHDVFDLTIGNQPFTGVQTPVFDETKVPIMPQGGFLGAVVSAINLLGAIMNAMFVTAVLAGWLNLVGFLDTIAAWAGMPNLFSGFFTAVRALYDYFASSITYLLAMLSLFFVTVLGPIMGNFLSVLTEVVTQWMGMYTAMTGLLTDSLGAGVSLWEDFNMSAWITIGAIFYPLYLLMLWEEKGMDAVINQLLFIKDIVMTVFGVFITVAQFFIALIGRIIESIPVAE